jgi:hypothetical protein
MEIKSVPDIAFVPDAVFGPGEPRRLDRETLVAQFNAAKARHAAASAARIESQNLVVKDASREQILPFKCANMK